MRMNNHWSSRKKVIGAACMFVPTLACAHGATNQSVAPFFLAADFFVLAIAIPAFLLSSKLSVRLSTLFAGINISVAITGIIACVFTMLEKTAPSTNDDVSFTIFFFSTSYVWIAIPIHFFLLLLLAVWRDFTKKPIPKKGSNHRTAITDD